MTGIDALPSSGAVFLHRTPSALGKWRGRDVVEPDWTICLSAASRKRMQSGVVLRRGYSCSVVLGLLPQPEPHTPALRLLVKFDVWAEVPVPANHLRGPGQPLPNPAPSTNKRPSRSAPIPKRQQDSTPTRRRPSPARENMLNLPAAFRPPGWYKPRIRNINDETWNRRYFLLLYFGNFYTREFVETIIHA